MELERGWGVLIGGHVFMLFHGRGAQTLPFTSVLETIYEWHWFSDKGLEFFYFLFLNGNRGLEI